MLFLRYLSENYDELMHNFNQHVQKESIVITFSLCTIFCLKHMINDILNLLDENSCEAVDKKILINDDDNLLLLSHDQMTI